MLNILRFVHMVNVDLIFNIVENLEETSNLLRNTHLKQNEINSNFLFKRLSVLYTRQEILHGPGNLLEIDEKGNIKILYQLILDMIKNKNILNEFKKEDELILLSLLERLFIVRKQLSLESVAAFIKILSKICEILVNNEIFCQILLLIIHRLLSVLS